MNFKHIMIVFKKEVKDIIRDKKTLITSLLVPIILMPVLFALMGGGAEKLQKDINENITIALSEESNTREIRSLVQQEIFMDNPNVKLTESVEDPIEAIRQEKVRFILKFEKDYQSKLQEGKPFSIEVMYDNSKTKSSGSIGILMEAIQKFNEKIVKDRLNAKGIDIEILEPVKVERTNVADEKQGGNMMLMMILPMMVSMLIAAGGIPPATDLVAGEKERATFEPLLTTKPSRVSILLGKYLTVNLFSMVSVIATFAGMAIGIGLNPGFMSMGDSGASMGGFYVPPVALVLSVLTIIALGMVFSGIQLALSTYAKSFKEAQTYLSFLIFAAMIPAYATMMMQPSDLQTYMFAVPLLNAITSLKMVLGGVINYTNLLIAFGTSMVYVVISLYFAAKLFNKEKVLFRS